MSGPNDGFIESVLNDAAQYLYQLADNAVGTNFDVYIDAADAILDVIGMWADEDQE